MLIVFFRTDDIIISVKSMEAKYLKLEELGAVLFQLSHNFPGNCLCLNAYSFHRLSYSCCI